MRVRAFDIKTIVPEHMETFFGDMDNEFLYEFESMFSDIMHFVVLMALIPVRNKRTVIVGYARLSHDRSADISCDIVNDGISGSKVGTGSMDIKTVIFFNVEPVYKSLEIMDIEEIRIKSRLHIRKKSSHPAFAEHDVRKERDVFPDTVTVKSTFSNDHMDMRIPFEITAESMQGADHAGSEISGMVHLVKPGGNGLGSRLEKDVEKTAVPAEVYAKLLSDSKNDMAVSAVDKLGRNGFRAGTLICNTAGITETRMASERDEAVFTTVGALKKSETIIDLTAA